MSVGCQCQDLKASTLHLILCICFLFISLILHIFSPEFLVSTFINLSLQLLVYNLTLPSHSIWQIQICCTSVMRLAKVSQFSICAVSHYVSVPQAMNTWILRLFVLLVLKYKGTSLVSILNSTNTCWHEQSHKIDLRIFQVIILRHVIDIRKFSYSIWFLPIKNTFKIDIHIWIRDV